MNEKTTGKFTYPGKLGFMKRLQDINYKTYEIENALKVAMRMKTLRQIKMPLKTLSVTDLTEYNKLMEQCQLEMNAHDLIIDVLQTMLAEKHEEQQKWLT